MGQIQRRSLKPTRIAVMASKSHMSPQRRRSFVSAIYGHLLESVETEQMCKGLGMTRGDVKYLRRMFDSEKTSQSDNLSIHGFLYLVDTDKVFARSQILTESLLRLSDVTNEMTEMTFDQFLRIVCTFAAFSELELYRFFYNSIFAKGFVTVNASSIREVLQEAGSSYVHNIEVAIRQFAVNPFPSLIGLPTFLTFNEFQKLVLRDPVIFFPVVQLQSNVRSRTLGKRYWERKAQEQELVASLLMYQHLNKGKLPFMTWKECGMGFLFGGETVLARARKLAR